MSQADDSDSSSSGRRRTVDDGIKDDWTCPSCGNHNSLSSTTCYNHNCMQPRPTDDIATLLVSSSDENRLSKGTTYSGSTLEKESQKSPPKDAKDKSQTFSPNQVSTAHGYSSYASYGSCMRPSCVRSSTISVYDCNDWNRLSQGSTHSGSTSENDGMAKACIPTTTNESVSTLFVVGITADFNKESVHEVFGRFGWVIRVTHFPENGYGFVRFASRIQAKLAMNSLSGHRVAMKSLNGQRVLSPRLSIMWAKRDSTLLGPFS